MPPVDLDQPALSSEQLTAAAESLTDKFCAQSVLAKWQEEMPKPFVRAWLFHLGLIAAHNLGRADEFIPAYERFLAQADLATKPDWHANLTKIGLEGSVLDQSGRFGQTTDTFRAEFDLTIRVLGPPELGPVLDVGCAGGAYSVNLANFGYRVTGTDHHAGVIEAAKKNAVAAGVESKAVFIVDDGTASKIADGSFSRAICIGVTVCLPSDDAFKSLIAHLDRVTKRGGQSGLERRVILGSSRWAPSRPAALRHILKNAPPSKAMIRLNFLQTGWWLHPRHWQILKSHFQKVTVFNKTTIPIDGERIDLLLE
jgi:SAM-dependent methyltransferase